MLWNEFIKLNHVSKLSLNEQLRKFNEYIMYEEQVAGSIIQIPVTITIAPAIGSQNGFGIVELYVNNTLVLTQTDLGSKSTLLNPGNTFFIKFYNTLPPYDGIEYTLRNNGVQISYGNTGDPVISPTFIATTNSNYVFTCRGFST